MYVSQYIMFCYFKGIWKVGGIYNVFELANQKGRLIFFKLVNHDTIL